MKPPRAPAAVVESRRAPVVAAPRRPVTHAYFGTEVRDDYEWLEDGQSEEVRSFTDAQNALARTMLDALPERAPVRARVAAILGAASPDWIGIRAESGRLFALKDAPPAQHRSLIEIVNPPFLQKSPKDAGSERVIVDANALDSTGATTIDFFVPSPNARVVAVSLSTGRSESGDLHLFDVATGKDRDETIVRVNGGAAGGSVAWNADGTGFYYPRHPRPDERPAADVDSYQEVWFHKLGTPASADVYAIGKEFPRGAATELLRSDDGRRVLAQVSNGGEVEHHLFDAGKWTRLSRFDDALSAATFGPDGRIYAVSRKGAPRGKVVAFAPPFDHATVVIPEGGSVIESVVATKTALYTIELVDGPSRVRRFPLGATPEPLARERPTKGKPAQPTTIAAGARGPAAAVLPLPAVASVTAVARMGDDLLLRVESFVEPPRWLFYQATAHRLVPTPLARKPAYETTDIEVVRESCVSEDGTRVPLGILRARDTKLDGSRPALLTGDGGFGITMRPALRPADRVWLDHGGIVAVANLRGGGERGESWHHAGRLTKKQNVFDDFSACARTLFRLGYTKPEHLAISGRGNGGLLVGASLVQHPEMFRAVAGDAGLYDMLRAELSPSGAANVREYGTVKDEAQFRALYAYSPFHNVKDAAAYPAVILLTRADDPRVDPYQSRKMVARLQAATSSDRPILLRASSGAGHGIPRAEKIEELTDTLTFLLHEVGAHP